MSKLVCACMFLFATLVVLSASAARTVPLAPASSHVEDSDDQTVVLRANAPNGQAAEGVKDEKNFFTYGGMGGFSGVGGYAGVFPALGGIGSAGGIGGVSGVGGGVGGGIGGLGGGIVKGGFVKGGIVKGGGISGGTILPIP